jgi:Ca-activated chloride channel family protein
MPSLRSIAIALALVADPPAAAQDFGGFQMAVMLPPVEVRQNADPRASIRVDTDLVLIPVTVTDLWGAPFRGLTRDAFQLFEDGIEQHVKHFASEDAPLSVGIIFDASHSMEGKLDQSRAVVARFLRTAGPGDEFFVVEFNNAPRLLCNFTSDTQRIDASLVGIEARYWTALLDAVYVSVHYMKHAKNPRRVLLILSDGGDNNSRYTEREIKSLVQEADVCIYSIGVGAGFINRNVGVLRQLSKATGGQVWEVGKISDLAEAVDNISAVIRHQYVLCFSSTNPSKNGLYRKIQVKLKPPPDLPPLRVSWRTGYYAPAGR